MGRAAGCWGGEARGGAGMAGGSAARVVRLLPVTVHRTPRRCLDDSALLAGSGLKSGLPARILGCRSRTAAKIGRRARLIREKIIGHAARAVAPRVASGSPLVIRCRPLVRLPNRGGMFALLHQPPRKQSRGVLFKPGVQQLCDLLAEIRRVAEARELIALQGISRRREKELPGRLGFVIQGDLQGKRHYITSLVTKLTSTHIRNDCGKVCKSFAPDREVTSCTAAGLGPL
jgi:hypothetical protein